MKRYLLLGLCVLFLGGFAISLHGAEKELPAPFEKAKEIAMKAIPDEDGDFLLEFISNKNGLDESKYFLAFIKDLGLIVIGRLTAPTEIFVYDEKEKSFGFLMGYFLLPIEEEVAVSGAFNIFREMVGRNLI